jgi:EmrB/QacA subfamily drug resistance transporter
MNAMQTELIEQPELPPPQSPARPASRTRLVLLLVGIELGQLLTALDQTVVGTAAPRILADLNGFSQYAWVATAYLLAATVTMPIYGKLSDMYGRRPFFLGGMLVFLAGSALAGASQSMTQLIAFRALQGLGGGAIIPIVSSIIGDVFPPAERGKWQGMTVSVWGIASILGPPVGGWITDQWGWRWVFYINMPIGGLALALTAVTLERQHTRRHVWRQRHAVDYLGALALTAATVPLLLAFSWAGTQYAWTSPIILGLLIFAAGMIGTLVLIERHAAEAIIPPALFANRIFAVSVIITFVVGAGLLGSLYFLPLFVQGVIGQSATNAGVTLTPIMFGVMLSSVVGGIIMSRTGHYKALALVGLAIATGGMFLLSRLGVHSTEAELARDMFVLGLGIGISMTLFTIIVQNAFPPGRIGQVTGALTFFREIGGTIGLAVLGSVMTNRFQQEFLLHLSPTLRQHIPPAQLSQLDNPQLLLSPDAVARVRQGFAAFGPPGVELFRQVMIAIQASLAEAIAQGFLTGMVLIALGLCAALFLREIPLRKRNGGEPTTS